jgi:hypothetical protein
MRPPCSAANGRRLAIANTRKNDCELHGYCKGNEYIEPSELTTFHAIVFRKGSNGLPQLQLHPNGTDPSPLIYSLEDKQLTPLAGRPDFAEGVKAKLESEAWKVFLEKRNSAL